MTQLGDWKNLQANPCNDQKERTFAKEITIYEVANGYILKQGQSCETDKFLVFQTMPQLVEWVQSWGE